jgi:hypothetical protein
MRKLYVGVGMLTSVCLIGLMATTANAAFSGKEAKEGSVKISAKEAISFKIEEKKEVKLELTCETVKGEGAVMTRPGLDGEEVGKDAPPLTPTTVSNRIALKLSFEKCNLLVGGVKSEATVSTKKCFFEFVSNTEGKEKEEGLFGLPTSENKSACVVTIEQPKKCRVEFGDKGGEAENESLSSLKLKAVKESESEIESGSLIKVPVVQTSGCTGVAEKTEGALQFKKGVAITGAGLTNPDLTINPREVRFGQYKPGEESILEGVFEVLPHEELEIKSVTLGFGEHFKVVKNTCTKGKKGTEPCEVGVKFAPLDALLMRKVDLVIIGFKVGAAPERLEFSLVRGTAVP